MKTFNKYPNFLWAFRYGCSATTWLSFVAAVAVIGTALLPAINVFAIRTLANSLAGVNSAIPYLLLISILFGAGNAIQQVANAIARMNALRIDTYATKHFNSVLTKVHPTAYESEEFMDSIRNARQSISEGHTSSQFQATVNVVCAVLTAISLSFALWDLSPSAALLSMLVPIPTVIAYGWYGKQESTYWPQASQCHRRELYLQDQIAYQSTGGELACMQASAKLAELADNSRRDFLGIRERLEKLSILSDTVSGLVTTLLFVSALWFIYSDSARDVGVIFAGIVGLMSGIEAMAGVGYQVGELITSIPANTHLRNFLNHAALTYDVYKPATVAELTAENITVKYGELTAVDKLSIKVKKGSLCALVGENGSGKTSLIKALTCMQLHATGTLYLDQKEIPLNKPSAFYTYATVQQDYGRYELTVRDFLTLGIPHKHRNDAEIYHALEFSEARGFVEQLPNKLDTALGTQWGGVNFSGGQWQRLAIARAVLSDAPVWFLDEPTSAVDAPTEERIFERLVDEAQKRIIILSSHRVSTLKAVQQIIVLQKGKQIETGTYSELLSEETEFYKMFKSQMSIALPADKANGEPA